jgi:hypothetical protein
MTVRHIVVRCPREEHVMDSTRWAWLLVVIGLIVLALAAFADPIGIGGDEDAFGWKQWGGVVVGGTATAAGLVLFWRQRTGSSSAQPD